MTESSPSGWTPYQPGAPPPPSPHFVNTSPPHTPATPGPTSSCVTRSKPDPEPAQIMAPCPEPWGLPSRISQTKGPSATARSVILLGKDLARLSVYDICV